MLPLKLIYNFWFWVVNFEVVELHLKDLTVFASQYYSEDVALHTKLC